MEIKTYIAGFANGWDGALKSLDEQVREDLGTDVRIHSVQDTLYRKRDLSFSEQKNSFDDHLARVVVYER